jgi:hypothetical protein
MSTDLAVTMDELEQECAELLPSRETLCVYGGGHGSSYSSTSIFSQLGYGNTAQSGLLNISALNGSANNILSLGSGNIGL